MMYPIYDPNTINVGGALNITNDTAPGFWSSLFNRWSRNALTGAEREQNEYNALEAQKAREFSASQAQAQMAFQSREAEIARDWQEQMYNQYQSPEAMMRQFQSAGLNPALMYGGASGGSIPSASSGPSGASGSVVSASGSPLSGGNLGLVASLAQLVKLRSEIDNIDADTANKTASAGLVSSQTIAQNISNYVSDAVKDVSVDIAFSNLAKLNNEVNLISNQIREAEFHVSTQEVRRGILLAEKVLKSWQGKELEAAAFMKSLEKTFYEEKGWTTPPSFIIPIVSAGILGGSKLVESVVGKLFDLRKLKLTPKSPVKTGSTSRKIGNTIYNEYHYE